MITIKRSTDGDRAAITRLAQLDDTDPPEGDALLAYVGDELWAALPLQRRARPVADPFHFTGDLLALLRFRASQEQGSGPVLARSAIGLRSSRA